MNVTVDDILKEHNKSMAAIVRKYLDDNGYDGLYMSGECACEKDDLFPCDGYSEECICGYKVDCEPGSEYDWLMQSEKPEATAK